MENDKQTYAIFGAAMSVHRKLERDFLEPVYQDAFEQEFFLQNIPFEREKELPVFYKKIRLRSFYRMDFVCYDSVIVELKASGFHRALLINFGAKSLEQKRVVLDHK